VLHAQPGVKPGRHRCHTAHGVSTGLGTKEETNEKKDAARGNQHLPYMIITIGTSGCCVLCVPPFRVPRWAIISATECIGIFGFGSRFWVAPGRDIFGIPETPVRDFGPPAVRRHAATNVWAADHRGGSKEPRAQSPPWRGGRVGP